MNNPQLKKYALEKLKEHNILEQLSSFGKPLFLTICGSHAFGFPSTDSDYDIRGVYIAPTNRFLQLRKKATEPSFVYMGEDRSIDICIDEISHYLDIVANKSSPLRIEWPNNDLVFYASDEYQNLKQTINRSAVCKDLILKYQKFAQTELSGKGDLKGVKRDLYALRLYLSAITICEQNQIISDINTLNKTFQLPIVDQMVKDKQLAEKAQPKSYTTEQLSQVVEQLDQRLMQSLDKSNLPQAPDIDSINNFLIRLRKRF